jgi:anthranilate synthase component 2
LKAKEGDGEARLEAKLESVKDKVIVIDNYDSFTFNLCQYLGNLGCEYVVFKNDEATTDQIEAAKPKGILVSPGPGTPEESGISLESVEKLGPKFPLFGVCLGHQCIGQIFGGKIIRAKTGVVHGKSSPVFHTDKGILKGLDR